MLTEQRLNRVLQRKRKESSQTLLSDLVKVKVTEVKSDNHEALALLSDLGEGEERDEGVKIGGVSSEA